MLYIYMYVCMYIYIPCYVRSYRHTLSVENFEIKKLKPKLVPMLILGTVVPQ